MIFRTTNSTVNVFKLATERDTQQTWGQLRFSITITAYMKWSITSTAYMKWSITITITAYVKWSIMDKNKDNFISDVKSILTR